MQQCAVQAVANLGVDATDAPSFLASGWHLALISLLSAAAEETQAAAAAVLGNLRALVRVRVALTLILTLTPCLTLTLTLTPTLT